MPFETVVAYVYPKIVVFLKTLAEAMLWVVVSIIIAFLILWYIIKPRIEENNY